MRSYFSVLFDVFGLAAIITGAWMASHTLGVVVLGLACLIVAWALDPPKRGTVPELPEEEEPSEPEKRSAIAPPPGLDWSPNE